MGEDHNLNQESAVLEYAGNRYTLPVVTGTENEKAIDISTLRKESGLITIDPGLGNTGMARSAITFIDGEKGILRYRGYPVEELAERSTFVETAYLILYGELPTQTQLINFSSLLNRSSLLHEDMRHFFNTFPQTPQEFIAANLKSALDPESLFVKHVLVNLRTEAGALSITDDAFTVHRGGEAQTRPIEGEADLRRLLRDRFGIDALPEVGRG